MGDKILTLHPAGKQGVNIDRRKYEQIKAAILSAIGEAGRLPFAQLSQAVSEHLDAPFEGSIPWYTISVKLDLEARGLVERLPGAGPQVLQLKD